MTLRELIKSSLVLTGGLVDPVLRIIDGAPQVPPLSLRAKSRRLGDWRPRRWLALGTQMRGEVQSFCDLKPEHDVLEMGCGAGIVVPALQSFLSTGSYTGIDVDPVAIDWCQRHYRDARFRFLAVDVAHDIYNSEAGAEQPRIRSRSRLTVST